MIGKIPAQMRPKREAIYERLFVRGGTNKYANQRYRYPQNGSWLIQIRVLVQKILATYFRRFEPFQKNCNSDCNPCEPD